MLGVAPSMPEARGINVWIFYPRIRSYGAELGMDRSQLLGHVMAHEWVTCCCHTAPIRLAVSCGRHGIEAQVRAAKEGLLTFTPDQAGLIRERLSSVPLRPVHVLDDDRIAPHAATGSRTSAGQQHADDGDQYSKLDADQPLELTVHFLQDRVELALDADEFRVGFDSTASNLASNFDSQPIESRLKPRVRPIESRLELRVQPMNLVSNFESALEWRLELRVQRV